MKTRLRLTFILLGTLFASIECAVTRPYTSLADISVTIETLSPKIVLLGGVPVLTQPNGYTCGITSVAILSSFYRHVTRSVLELIEQYHVETNHGCSNADLQKWISRELPGSTIDYHRNESNAQMIRAIHGSLASGRPALIMFGSPNPYNPPYYDFHVSILYGMNLVKRTVTISNAYGYSEEILLIDFLNRMAFTELEKYPEALQNIIKRNERDLNAIMLVEYPSAG